MKPMHALLTLALTALLLPACTSMPVQVSGAAETPIRAAAREFTTALKQGDAAQLKQSTTMVDADHDTKKLAEAVVADTVAGRQVHLQLAQRFHHVEPETSVVGSDAWIAQLENAATRGPILQAGNRVLVGEAGKDGSLFLRQENGQWRVELVPTLVAESGGRTQVRDAIVDYRFNVTRAVNQHLLDRLSRDEFTSIQQYEEARNAFWFQYLAIAMNGKDPRDTMLATLPKIPDEPLMATERH